jgi:diamine N-acetyltransferase
MGVEVHLKKIDRGNWREMLALKTRPDQEMFVASPARSLAQAYVRPFGTRIVHTVMAVYDGDTIVGYVGLLSDPGTVGDYWIDDIMIDQRYQRRGYGRAAMIEAIKFLRAGWARCKAIRLSCHRNNRNAAALYLGLGFRKTARFNHAGEPIYELNGEQFAAYAPEPRRKRKAS